MVQSIERFLLLGGILGAVTYEGVKMYFPSMDLNPKFPPIKKDLKPSNLQVHEGNFIPGCY